MGMYTELVFIAEFKQDLPPEVENVVKYMFSDDISKPEKLPMHAFFQSHRWEMIGSCSSFYFTPFATSHLRFNDISKSYYVCSRSDLKNYGDEIALFIDWVTPYIETCGKTCIGWHRYEENEEPTIIYIGDSE